MLTVRLKSARKAKKLTQDDLAKKVNTTKATISNYENGYSTPSNDMLLLLANALDISTDYLLGRTDNSKLINYNNMNGEKSPLSDQDEFEKLMNSPEEDQFYKEFKESPEERRKALLAAWEYLKSLEKK
ncbi:helix-turn-helix domain-containing protein [Planomicrobium okeanokoites]|uniref:helix-turn-helix domain-containing protein n=1 Tax=Planomicrobium okeanokoites TaxID=244 RepID=UPI000A007997|nr:helix-turn-helix domain-containing protein [Planomicrobium okeanokoites]